jgi:hypothetical protein
VETEADYVLWVPAWFYHAIDLKQETAVLFSCSSSLPRATQLNFTTESSLPDWLDLREVLEGVFSQLGVLKRGQVFPVPLLDNAVLTTEISDPYVFLHGEEVAFDVAKLVRVPVLPPAEELHPERDIESQRIEQGNQAENIDFSSMFGGSMFGAPKPEPKVLFPGRGRKLNGSE